MPPTASAAEAKSLCHFSCCGKLYIIYNLKIGCEFEADFRAVGSEEHSGQFAGYLLDHSFSYMPVLAMAGSLHIAAFLEHPCFRAVRPLCKSIEPHWLEAVIK